MMVVVMISPCRDIVMKNRVEESSFFGHNLKDKFAKLHVFRIEIISSMGAHHIYSGYIFLFLYDFYIQNQCAYGRFKTTRRCDTSSVIYRSIR